MLTMRQMGLSPSDLYQRKRKQWEQKKPFGKGGGGKGGGITRKETSLREIGYSLSKVISHPGKEGAFPLDDLSHILNIKIEKIPEFITWAREKINK